MKDQLGAGTHVGYCTNVHPGESLPQITANLTEHAAAVRRIVSPAEPLGVGLWLPARAAVDGSFAEYERLRAALHNNGLYVFTLNGFPYGDFQAAVVKRAVYKPDWSQPERLEYTRQLALRLASLSEGAGGSISTLPIGWKADFQQPAKLEAAAHALRKLAATLRELHERHGCLIHVDLEPEPGCVLETSGDVVAFFERYFLHEKDAEVSRRYLRVCHDVCHAAVMFESQEECFRRYRDAGIEVGKVQISAALRVDFDELDEPSRVAAIDEYERFVEPRFLHQTVVQRPSDGATKRRSEFFEDLPLALDAAGAAIDPKSKTEIPKSSTGEWRTHFHVPIFLDRIGRLGTTQGEIAVALRAARELSTCRHFEVETYAWNVLPAAMRIERVSDGIARELTWVRELVQREQLA